MQRLQDTCPPSPAGGRYGAPRASSTVVAALPGCLPGPPWGWSLRTGPVRVAVCLTFMFRSPYETFLEVVEFLMNAFPRMLLNDGSGGSLFLFWHHAHQARCCWEQVWSPGGDTPPCAAAPSACLSRTLGPSGRAGPQAAVPGFLSAWLPLPSPWAL